MSQPVPTRHRLAFVTGPQPRPNVGEIPAYVPGKPPTVRPGMTSYKLSSNENPYPPLPGVVEAATRAVETMNRYPDMGSAALYDALAARLRVPADHLAAATGSVALIYQLLAAFCEPGDEVVYAWRSFEAYPIAVASAAATSVQVPVTPDGRHDLDAMAAAVTDRTRAVIVCTPNNPTGPAVTQTELDAFLDRIPEHVVVVVDEAYVEFVRMDDAGRRPGDATPAGPTSCCSAPSPRPTAWPGSGSATPSRSRTSRRPCGPCRCRSASRPSPRRPRSRRSAAEAELLARVDALVAERDRVGAALRESGWDVPEAQGNFFWFALGERTADFAAAADERGIVVRPFAGEGCRVSVGEVEANDRLVDLARAFLE